VRAAALAAAAAIVAGLAAGCDKRNHVKDPEQAMQSNDLDWSVEWKPEPPASEAEEP
jgi:hypothetical protein